MTARRLYWLALAVLPAGFSSAQATVFQGAPGAPGNVVVHPGPGSAAVRPPELQGIVLLPVEAAGRTDFTQFLPDQPRRKTDIPLAARILLPQQQGSLYRYRRPVPAGAEFGYFVVGPDGLAKALRSFPGTGANGLGDPIPGPVAFSAAGDAMLAATTLEAGGDVIEFELDTGTTHLLTAGDPPLDVLPQGLVLLPNWGAVLTSSGPLRFNRGGGALERVALWTRAARAVPGHNPGAPVPPVLTHFGSGLVRSADGGSVAMVAGASPALGNVFTFQLAGAAVCVNDTPAPITDPSGNTDAGPFLALSPNGRRAAWKTDNGLTGEVFSREVTSLPTAPEFQITADAHFTDTLNDTGVIAFFDPDSVVVLVGEPNGAGGVEKGDLYRARFDGGSGTPSFTNLSNTSGDTVAPFLVKGEIETSDGIFQIPGQAGSVYFVSGSSGQGEVYRLNAATGIAEEIRNGIDALDFIERAGPYFVLEVLHDSPFQRELVRIPFDHSQPATSIGLFPGGQRFTSPAGNVNGVFAAIFNASGTQRLLQMSVATKIGTFLPGTYQFGTALGFDGNGAVLGSVLAGSASHFFSWSLASGSAIHGSGPAQSFVLPAL